MSKPAFVVDEPNQCAGCLFCGNEYVGESMNKEYVTSYCGLNGYEIKNIESKPGWCLLRLFPEKKESRREENKMNCTVSMHYKIIGSDIFNFEDGYMEINVDYLAKSLDLDLDKIADKQKKGIADMFHVAEENVILISRTEYEENTRDE